MIIDNFWMIFYGDTWVGIFPFSKIMIIPGIIIIYVIKSLQNCSTSIKVMLIYISQAPAVVVVRSRGRALI